MTTPTAAPVRKPYLGFIIAPVLFVLTSIIGVVLIVLSVTTIANTINGFERVDAGEVAKIRLSPGEYYVFVGALNTESVGAVEVFIEDPNGDLVQPSVSGTSYSADDGGMHYASAGTFEVPTPGTYYVEVDGPRGTTARIGKVPGGRIVLLLVGGIAVGTLGFIAALIIMIVAIVRRVSANRRARGPVVASAAPAPGTAPSVMPAPEVAPPPPPAPPAAPPSAPPPPPPAAPPVAPPPPPPPPSAN